MDQAFGYREIRTCSSRSAVTSDGVGSEGMKVIAVRMETCPAMGARIVGFSSVEVMVLLRPAGDASGFTSTS